MSPRHTGPHGALKAAALFPDQLREALAEYERLNTREARAAFADRWVGIWSHDFDAAWPMLYKLLELIKDDQLYADARRVGLAAPGGRARRGKQSSYDSFEDYFNDRVRQPFQRWAELEQTYRYVSEYAPDLLRGSFGEARKAVQRRNAADEVNQQQRPLGTNQYTEGFDNVQTRPPTGNSVETALRRLRKDRKDLHAKVLAGELTPHGAMVEAGFRHLTITIPADDPERIAATLRRRLDPDMLAALVKLLTS